MTFRTLALLSTFALTAFAADPVDYAKQIQPLLEEHCIDCHGPDKQKANLRLDQRPVMLRGGDSGLATIVPGKPEKSYLIEVVKQLDPEMAMPPKGDPLSKADVALLERWIAEGANWPGQMDAKLEVTSDLWSLQPVERPAVPDVAGAGSDIDAFLLTALKEKGLAYNPPADARSLIRRASILLTGLPPTPGRQALFLQDHAKDADRAYRELIEELLDSSHFGERWAQHWLDVIRWAETNGSESNLYRKNAWIYRDYVVRAFNEDRPYDRFIVEQLAGDQFGMGEATGFLVAGPHVPAATVGREPTAIRQARADRLDEIMQTVGASMLGVTISCARCHNHKFDPISIQDYYSLTAVFQGVEFGGRYPEFGDEHPRKKRATELYPEMFKQRRVLRDEIRQWPENWGGFLELAFPATTTKALRVEFAWPNIGVDELDVYGPADYKKNLALASDGTTLKADDAMTKKGNEVFKANDGEVGTMAWRAKGLGKGKNPWVEIHFEKAQEVNRFRYSANREYYYETDFLTKNSPKLGGFKIKALQDDGTWKELGNTGWAEQLLKKNAKAKAAHDKLQQLIDDLQLEGPRHSFIGKFAKPVVTKVLHRGSPENPRDEVPPAGFSIMGGDLGLDGSAPDAARRRAYAEWLVRPEHTLTSRVMVNRVWHHLFGAGLVSTTSDFGEAGARPTHPELLDYLAAEFVKPTTGATAWSVKDLLRSYLLTDAFRQSSAPRTDGLDADAGAMLLWRFPPRRVEAEVIRDSILQASSKLDRTLGGPSYRIHNVKKTYAQWEVIDNHSDQTWRRMLYQERMRRVDDQIFTAFDFPDCGQVRAKRPVSTTPLQALNLMNSPFAIGQAQHIADRAKSERPKAPIERLWQIVLGRSPDAGEREAAQAIAEESGLHVVARSLINSNEFAFLP